jgi:hypothetical protein
MIDPAEHGARSAANRLSAQHGPRLITEVEAALQARGSTAQPDQYFDPVSLGALIVSIASLTWTVYTDLRKKTPSPRPDVVARTVRVRLRNGDELDLTAHDLVIEITVDETLRAASPDIMDQD